MSNKAVRRDSSDGIPIATLADYRRHGMRIWAHCAAPLCGHASVLDLGGLIDRLGPDRTIFGSRTIAQTVVCTRCGQKGATFTVSPAHVTAEIGARREKGGAN